MAPNSVVAGDFDPKNIRPLVDKLFGTLAPGQTKTLVQELATTERSGS